MEKYVKKVKFIKEDMIHNNTIQCDFYDIITEDRPMEMVKNDGNPELKFGIKVIMSPISTTDHAYCVSYNYKEREHRDNDFEELVRFKKMLSNELS